MPRDFRPALGVILLRPPRRVARLLAQLLGPVAQDLLRERLAEEAHGEELHGHVEQGGDPEDPAPVDPPDDEGAHDRRDAGADERDRAVDGLALAALLLGPAVC